MDRQSKVLAAAESPGIWHLGPYKTGVKLVVVFTKGLIVVDLDTGADHPRT